MKIEITISWKKNSVFCVLRGRPVALICVPRIPNIWQTCSLKLSYSSGRPSFARLESRQHVQRCRLFFTRFQSGEHHAGQGASGG